MKEITDVDTDMQPGGLEADLVVDRDSASRLGLTEIQIDNALGNAFAQSQVSTIYNPFSPQQYHVVMEVAPEFWQNPDVLKQLWISTSGGAVTGTQATQAVAGTTVLKSAGAAASTSTAVAEDAARNLAANSLANAGRGNTSPAPRSASPRETVVPFSAFSHFTTGTRRSASITQGHLGVDGHFIQSAGEGVAADALDAINRKMNEIHVPVSIRGGTYGHRPPLSTEQQQHASDAGGRADRDLRGAGSAL